MEERWVSVGEAATLEGVHKSSISRFIGGNRDVPVKRSAPTEAHPEGIVLQVEYNHLHEARRQSLDVLDKASGQKTVFQAPPVASEPFPVAPGDDFAKRKRKADAITAELDLAERMAEVVDVKAVTHAVETAGAAFVQALERRRRKLATDIAGVEDVRAVELLIKSADNELLACLVRDLTASAKGMTTPDQAAEEPAEA